jgi:dTDP-4-amino-4,6-dideoxygalactose transaminase
MERFEGELKEHFGVRHCFLLSTGKAALTVILQSIKELVPDRDEVIIPAYTCYSVPAAVIRAGLKVVLCDIDRCNLGFDPSKLATLLRKRRPLCLVPTHLYGMPCPMDSIISMAKDRGTMVVEDAAQAMGSEVGGIKLGVSGDAGFFSLGRGKALSTVEGGVVITDRDDIARQIRQRVENLQPYGLSGQTALLVKGLALCLLLRPALFWLPKAIPFLGLGKTVYDPGFALQSMSPFQAGLSWGWRNRISRFRTSRRKLVQRWQLLAEHSRWLENIGHDPGGADLIRFPLTIGDRELRNQVLLESERLGLGIMGGYPTSINRIGEIAHLFAGESYPAAEKAARELVTIPVHPLVTHQDVEAIEKLVKEW